MGGIDLTWKLRGRDDALRKIGERALSLNMILRENNIINLNFRLYKIANKAIWTHLKMACIWKRENLLPPAATSHTSPRELIPSLSSRPFFCFFSNARSFDFDVVISSPLSPSLTRLGHIWGKVVKTQKMETSKFPRPKMMERAPIFKAILCLHKYPTSQMDVTRH